MEHLLPFVMLIPIVTLVISDYMNTRNIHRLQDQINNLQNCMREMQNKYCDYSQYKCKYTNKYPY